MQKKLFLEQQQLQSAGNTQDNSQGTSSPGDNGMGADKRKRLQFTNVVVRSVLGVMPPLSPLPSDVHPFQVYESRHG